MDFQFGLFGIHLRQMGEQAQRAPELESCARCFVVG